MPATRVLAGTAMTSAANAQSVSVHGFPRQRGASWRQVMWLTRSAPELRGVGPATACPTCRSGRVETRVLQDYRLDRIAADYCRRGRPERPAEGNALDAVSLLGRALIKTQP